jgi:DNA polymerase I-like protein with 3'-5' exonuclease and polymerase domains
MAKPGEDIVDLLRQLQDRSAENAATKALLTELSTAFADILGHLEESGPATAEAVSKGVAEALAACLKDIKLESNPQVTMQLPAKQSCDIKFNWEGNRITGASVTHK